MKEFIATIQTTIIGTLDAKGLPFSSYAPYIYDANRFYVYISDIATHAKNIQRNPKASLFFVEDESKTENVFARKRVSLQCDSQKIERGSDRFEEVLGLFAEKFDAKMVGTLKKMLDFNLYEFKVTYGEATFGFGKAYFIGGKNMDELVERTGDNPHHGVK
ncbi:HugZ family protein [Sulfurospirillum barnesii]|uniref:Putative heme iron utilization protein n=1 Tax=Sulfurospirillum barnesii (strain ATCC 700032 / DSM 10660 / SES-3) TaxID=760154 RepID=I3XVD5_SULBS|nr:pyridoxamine 5'-phosphate oxidase family protein [Sulfurospirillum barnesii]AFL67909.1 putative heme iron utilization protein [Sulfurospirillum barnesii SES-3]